MTEESKSEIVKQVTPKDSFGAGQSDDHNKNDEGDLNQAPQHSRKPALSKREIMEELSRARFPWDE